MLKLAYASSTALGVAITLGNTYMMASEIAFRTASRLFSFAAQNVQEGVLIGNVIGISLTMIKEFTPPLTFMMTFLVMSNMHLYYPLHETDSRMQSLLLMHVKTL